tara:strand:+ start:314 stop:1624 length:1311 start_codon:yes stop_codon:yes gene_type:complete
VYPITLREIVQTDTSAALISAADYYSYGGGEDRSKRQLMIRKGTNLKKIKKALKRIIEGQSVGKDGDRTPAKLGDADGNTVSSLEIVVDEHSMMYFIETLDPTFDELEKFVKYHDLKAKLQHDGLKYFAKAMSLARRIYKKREATFYFFELRDQNKFGLFQNCVISIFSMILAMNFGMSEEEVKNIGLAGLFHDAGDEDHLSAKEATRDTMVERKIDAGTFILQKLDIDPKVIDIVRHQHDNLVDMKENKDSAILQTVIALACYTNKGTYCVGHHIEEVDAGRAIHSAVAKLVIASNPKVNETCPEAIFNEKVIDRLATVFGFGYLITKERQIRNEILKSCKYSNVLSNRASVACEHPHFEESTSKEIPFCDGQSFPTNICGNRGRSRLVPKCLVGCELLADINEEYTNQSEESKPSSSNSNGNSGQSSDQNTSSN